MNKSIQRKLQRYFYSNTSLDKKALNIRKSWDEVEHFLCDLTKKKSSKRGKK